MGNNNPVSETLNYKGEGKLAALLSMWSIIWYQCARMAFITGDRIGVGASVDWRAASRRTVDSFRQNIKVLQQLLRAQRLKSEQRQAHRELLLLPGKQILP